MDRLDAWLLAAVLVLVVAASQAQVRFLVPAALLGLLPAVVLKILTRQLLASAAGTPVAKSLQGKQTVGFFHPYAHAGGGGELVLWCAIHAVQRLLPGVVCVVYTGDMGVGPAEFLAQARSRFGVEVDTESVRFIHLSARRWVESSSWPRVTLLGQSLGSIVLGWEALGQFRPDVFIDSMGYAFTLPLFALVGRCRIGCYVHYPTISTDMLSQVRSRSVGVCNNADVARSPMLSAAKLLYYHLFAMLYGIVGRFAEVVLVNSSWTYGHIEALWRIPRRTTVVYPPCDTAQLAGLPLERSPPSLGGRLVVSLAQFRPEKNHALQLRAFARFLEQAPEHREARSQERVRLVVAGGCRDAGDRGRVVALQKLCSELGLREEVSGSPAGQEGDWDVSFRTNISVAERGALLGEADVGLHTMKDEHFGINVVEFMAAGAVALAHGSAGPLLDIVTPVDGSPTGYLATDEEGYASALQEIFALGPEGRQRIAKKAREAVLDRFSIEAFEQRFVDLLVGPLTRRQNGELGRDR